MRTRPSPVDMKTLSRPQPKAIWLVWTGCWWLAMGVDWVGERMWILSVFFPPSEH